MKKHLHLLLVLFFVNLLSAQNLPNDCVNAVVVSGNGVFMTNATGYGAKQEVAGCASMEHNSFWMKITIVQSGTLGFDLIPNDPAITADYDFWVYGPNKTCAALGSPIRCCTTNPQEAGLTNNLTGMGNSLSMTAGPGANGTGYVKWLDVKVGETYYIAIDRPYVDEGGFQIQWTGTATAGTGAFAAPPIANKIADLLACTTSNTAFFSLDRSQISPDLTNNTVTFHGTLGDAVDGKNPLSGIISVSTANSKPIYAKVVNNLGGYYTLTDFTLRAFPVPTASIALSKPVVCAGENITVTFTGTPGATVDYKIDGGPIQSILLDVNGTFLLSDAVSANRTYTVAKAEILDENNNEVCFQSLNDSKTVAVNACSTLGVEAAELMDFSTKVYPNPFNTAFVIDVNTLSQEPLKIKVYDMLGRLVEQKEGNPNKMAEQRIGQNYASGIYNIVVTQEDVVKTLRIIKE